jgi:hypothetical protein
MKLPWRKQNTPTDLAILDTIYEDYYDSFAAFSKNPNDRRSKIYVPIDIESVADKLGVDADIIFGRLYYHLEERYGYARQDGVKIRFFALRIGEDKHCIHFPYLASVLANLRDDRHRHVSATTISIVSLALALASLVISLAGVR